MIGYFPDICARRSILCYVVSLLLVSILFMNRAMPFYIYVFGLLSVCLFFVGSSALTKQWRKCSENLFVQRLFATALVIRLCYIILIFFLNQNLYGHFWESNAGDIDWYMSCGQDIAHRIREGQWDIITTYLSYGVELDDMGYNLYLGILYFLTGGYSLVIVPLILKSFFGAWTCILIYRISKRHFGDNAARIAGVFCALQFNMIWWCGSMMKETEMIFLSSLFIETIDQILSSPKPTWRQILVASLSGTGIFFFRTVLGLIALLAALLVLFIGRNQRLNTFRRIVSGCLVVVVLALTVGASLLEKSNSMIQEAMAGESQTINMNWRASRSGGNSLAAYAGAAVFAPLIFTMPFPSMTYTNQEQEMQMQVNGGNFEKNILSLFVILVFFKLICNGDWKQHILPMFFLLTYLISLVLSEFAQSGRYHMPAIPFEMMFAAYGISIMDKKYLIYFKVALIVEVLICVGWNWFKLAGRGMA